ncbi:unnamed protein product [Rotaria sordida]|uniref:RNA-directed DNA polymerase n=1 Tax=Rotaria sordida TaxID=392033 RepID=A0A815RX87_9BILA|nr:unnamed protein product [Rotaria sordida]
MVDTGATHSLIARSTLNNFPHLTIQETSITTAILGDASTIIPVHGLVRLCIYINHIPTFTSVFVVDSLGADLILGMDWCHNNDILLRVREQQLVVRHPQYGITKVHFLSSVSVPVRLAQSIQLNPHHEHIVRLITPLSSAACVSYTPDNVFCRKKNIVIPEALLKINRSHAYLLIYNAANTPNTLRKNTVLGTINFFTTFPPPVKLTSFSFSTYLSFPNISSFSLSSIQPTSTNHEPTVDSVIQNLVHHIADKQEQNDFSTILQKNRYVFDMSKHTVAKTKLPHVIITGDHHPISVRPYYRTIEQRKELQQEIDKLLMDNIICPSTSPWSSPVILKKKPDGTYRFLVDFRRLNSITKKDAYPQPSAEELIFRLSRHSYFTKLDLKSGYFQIPIVESDKEKTGFVTPDGHYEFNVLAQGLMNAPASFQRVMNNLLATGRWDYVVVYLDDIVIFSHSLQEHKRHVNEILSILNAAHFKVSPPKCQIAVRCIEFLGHIITANTVKPSPEKIQAILDIPPPHTLSQANRFLGKIGYYRKFIPDFARIAAPLHKVTNKTRTKRHEFYWHAEQQAAFEQFKNILTTAPLFLHFPDPSVPFILSTDASLTRIAGVLKQQTSTGLKVCYYKSRLLSDTERRYSTTEREALAIYWCVDQLRPYITGSSVIIETDHEPLSNMHKKHNFGNKRIDNWLLKLQDMLPHILAIKYRKGVDNVGPDFLTRYEPLESPLSTPVLTSPSTIHLSDNTFDSCTPLPQREFVNTCHSSNFSWPPGTETWDSIVLSPVVTRSKARATISPPIPVSPTETSLDIPPNQDAEEYFDALNDSNPISPSIIIPSNPDPPTLDLSLTRMKTEQHSDPDILSLIQRLRSRLADPYFTLDNDMVYRIIAGSHTSSPSRVPYLPKSLISLVLHTYHDHPLSGHFGVHRTLLRIRDRFWWPNMRKSIQNYVASCTQCARHNILRTKTPGHLKSIQPPSAVFQVLHMDFWGPVRTPSASGNRYVIVLTDNLSKYVIADALPDCTAKSAAQFFIEKFILVHGVPERLITDNGTHFNNHLLHAITSTMNIAHAFSVPYHPQTNGQVERFNATFQAQLAKYSEPERTDWDFYLPSIVYAYNTSVHSTTKLTPYELAFARHPKSPFDSVSPTINLPPAHIFYPYLQRIRRVLTTNARTNILRHQSRSQQQYNKNRRNPCYSVGDHVYVQVSTGRAKLDARWIGPCTVIQTAGQQRYLVRDDLTGHTDWNHVSQLHPIVERQTS